MQLIPKVFAQDDSVTKLVGTVNNPLPYASLEKGGLILLFTNILRLVFVAAGIYAFFNLIVAGYTYLGAGGDAKKIEQAWNQIWLSLLGLIIIVASFAMAALFGYVIFNDPMFILKPTIYGPTVK